VTVSAESFLIVVFTIGAAGAVYAYAMFPALAVAMGTRASGRVSGARNESLRGARSVTLVIPAYNEERCLEARIRNALAADYPRHLLEVVVVSDASTDRTNDIARSFADEGVRLIVQETRRGKSEGVNHAMRLTRGEIVVFTDANSSYSPTTIPALVSYFERPEIGLVTGYTRYVASGDGNVAETSNAYTSVERVIKTVESRWGCCVGADGAVFAMRRSLFRPLRHDDINDLVLPLTVIEQGFQCVLADDAFCTEPPGESVDSEYRRQSRIANRTLRALWRHVRLLNPVRFGLFSFFLFSHKVVRMLAPLFLMLALVSLAILAGMEARYLAAAVALFAILAAAVDVSRRPATSRWLPMRLLRQLGVFLTINAAVLEGWWKFLRGQREVVWQHDRSGG
jgi:cellulose synthase/poly-beta-1,6-N-acetylglucosamine synthase-like glycosyltransferase